MQSLTNSTHPLDTWLLFLIWPSWYFGLRCITWRRPANCGTKPASTTPPLLGILSKTAGTPGEHRMYELWDFSSISHILLTTDRTVSNCREWAGNRPDLKEMHYLNLLASSEPLELVAMYYVSVLPNTQQGTGKQFIVVIKYRCTKLTRAIPVIKNRCTTCCVDILRSMGCTTLDSHLSVHGQRENGSQLVRNLLDTFCTFLAVKHIPNTA